jgi:hypothetical protein
MSSLYPSQLFFLARVSLLLCDFHKKKKKEKENKIGITRLITVLCLSISHNSQIQDLDHVLRRKHLGTADMSHPADLSHVLIRVNCDDPSICRTYNNLAVSLTLLCHTGL